MSGIDYQAVAVNAATAAAQKVRRTGEDIEADLAHEATAEHLAAKRRGATIREVAARVAWELHAKGQLRGSHLDLERELKLALADALYPGVAVDL
jgi:hypothetical protein